LLSHEERAQILLEERYRAEVRRSADEELPKKSALTRFVNSNFGLWLLSAIFISGLGTGIAWYKDYLGERSRNRDAVERIDIEIAYRLSQLIGYLDVEFQQRERGELKAKPGPSFEGPLIEALTNQKRSALLPLYPQFEKLSVGGLMAELRRHIDPSRRTEVDEALLTLTNGTLTRDATENPKVVAGRIVSDVLNARREWREAKFAYTDCSLAMPFC
jgi:hypothetical protein